MSLFPDTIKPDPTQSKWTESWKTAKLGPTDGDFIQRRQKRSRPLAAFKLVYGPITEAEMATLYDFWYACKGSLTAFSYFHYRFFNYVGIQIGIGDGVTDTFDLGGKDLSSPAVYVDGAPVIPHGFGIGAGTDGQDNVGFTGAGIPSEGAIITATWRGRKYFPTMIFTQDDITPDMFPALLFKTGLEIAEVSS